MCRYINTVFMADGENGENGKEQRNRKERGRRRKEKKQMKKPDGEMEVWSSEAGQ